MSIKLFKSKIINKDSMKKEDLLKSEILANFTHRT